MCIYRTDYVITMELLIKLSISRELLDSMQAGTLEPEVAFLNASLVWLFYMSIYFFLLIYADMLMKSTSIHHPFVCLALNYAQVL